jgi:hypothetical protein
MLFCLTNISAKNLPHILGNHFGMEHHILVHLCQLLLPLKALKKYAQILLCFGTKNVGEIAGNFCFFVVTIEKEEKVIYH